MQLSLFDNIGTTKEEFAQRICDELNKLETIWKGSFYVKDVSLSHWQHVNLENRVLEICIKATKQTEDQTFIQLRGDRESQLNLYNAACFSKYLADLEKDKDFSYCVTPWIVFIYYHNWELKKV